MNKQKISIISVIIIIFIIVIIAVFALSQKKQTDKPQDETQNSENATEISESFDVRPESEADIPTVTSSETGIYVNDDSTQDLSVYINSIIDDSYKTSSYACDIITQESVNGSILSIQIESSSFSEESGCIEAAKSIIEQALDSEYYKDIQAFDFSFMADSQVTYIMLVDDAQSITSPDMIEDKMKIQEF